VRIEYLRLGLTAALALVLGIAVFNTEPESDNPPEEAPAGRLLFVSTGCVGCHRIGDNDPSMEIGPSLIGLAERAGQRVPELSAAEYVTQSIREPRAFTVPGYEAGIMPAFSLTEAEIQALAEYLLNAG
jgi:mono/diheme cytochrome c family protein